MCVRGGSNYCTTIVQIDNPARLANELVNATENSEEIKKEDVSLTVELLSTVANSMDDLQAKDVSSCTSIWLIASVGAKN